MPTDGTWHVAFDVGHTTGSGGNPPAEYQGLREDDIAFDYASAAHASVKKGVLASMTAPFTVIPIRSTLLTYGTYTARQAWAVTNRVDIYICCHTNSVPKDHPKGYGLVLGRPGSSADMRLAWNLSDALIANNPGYRYDPYRARVKVGKRPVIVDEVGPTGYREKNPWPAAAWSLMKGLPASCATVVLEPGILNDDDHAAMWETPQMTTRLGENVARGIKAFIVGAVR